MKILGVTDVAVARWRATSKPLEISSSMKDVGMRKIAVIIRHAERDSISKGEFGNEACLTCNGESMAKQFGARLAGLTINHIYSSPIVRCMQTAELVAKGIGKNVEITKENSLGNPGLHIQDAFKAGRHYLDLGAVGVFERFARGEHLEGLATIEYLRSHAMRWFESKTLPGEITLFITHDALIAHVAFANGIAEYSRDSWVGYLDGIIVDFSKEELR